MKLPHAVPSPNGTERSRRAKQVRDIATETARLRPHAQTRTNREEEDYASACFPASFTKGLAHDEFGVLNRHDDYAAFVEAINSEDDNLFVSGMFAAQNRNPLDGGNPSELFECKVEFGPQKNREDCGCATKTVRKAGKRKPNWRGWESPRAGHVFDLEGPDAGAVGMAPAPRVVSSELAAEMAEVYALAVLRDVRFTDIVGGKSKKRLCDEKGTQDAQLDSAEIAGLLNAMPFFSGKDPVSSTQRSYANHPKSCAKGSARLDRYERNRRFARTQSDDGALTPQNIFRGSTAGALAGPYISQFMLIGSPSLASDDNCSGRKANENSLFDAVEGIGDGFIRFGTQFIDQRVTVHKPCLDHMTDWNHWRDVQNGADLRGQDRYLCRRRFITTPRDLATYVHFDALYQAYLNAVLLIDSIGTPVSKGFPEPSYIGNDPLGLVTPVDGRTPQRTGFATFGGPHILSLVTEVATRCLKAVRRQKFNFHRRPRPELMGGRFTLVDCGHAEKLGCAGDDFSRALSEIPDKLRMAIVHHNKEQNTDAMAKMRGIYCPDAPKWLNPDCNLLLPMAFPEGSPMHPAYGAGHATVAGGCVTMVKAFFEMFEDCDSNVERPLCFDGQIIDYVPDSDGRSLNSSGLKKPLTIQGELDKLAANISIGRNMAGVHYYSDYYDSLRLGERIAVGILLEQAPTYDEPVETTFTSYDGDHITIAGQGDSAGMLSILDRDGNPVSSRDWWLRHVAGEEIIMDF
ncbi:phosphatase PAP2 family protein [Erythrobacter rubeus]|uniref:Bromoperoxidase n=1 Tax=Erythrobacter rubeus TaxID=2760803 RepID=A0ABR8KPJ5_9SPHN|nr:bromoperoxidase [Erythrobacter rubeus]MBD2842627.1 bromoperoxidase [Erythrobacter rubeus]